MQMVEYEYGSRMSKPIENLMNKGLEFSSFSIFQLKTNFSPDFSFKGQSSVDFNKSSSAISKLRYKISQFSLLQKFDSDLGFKTNINYVFANYPEFILGSDIKLNHPDSCIGLSVKHVTPLAELSVFLRENLNLDCILVRNIGKNSKIDLFVSLSPFSQTLNSFRAAYSWINKDFSLVFKDFLSNSPSLGLGNFRFLGLFNWSEQTSLSWDFGIFSKENIFNAVKLGIQLKPTPKTLIKLRFDQDANCCLLVKTELTPWISFSTSTQHNLFDPTFQKMSFYFNLAPKT